MVSFKRYRSQLAAIRHRPPRVTAFRAAQEFRLLAMENGGGWGRVQRRVAARSLDPAALGSLGWLPTRTLPSPLGLQTGSATAPRTTVEVLGDGIDLTRPIDWHRDWRHDHSWPLKPFRSYDFYEPRERPRPYDVRVMWELNRLNFLPALAHRVVADGSDEARDLIETLVRDWSANNPLAASASWQPMEASMRLVSLATTLSCLAAGGLHEGDLGQLLIRQIAEHAEFVWRTREFTDVRGNHYAANVVALLLSGQLLRSFDRASNARFEFARAELVEEIMHQFHPDGTSIEASLCYHRLTLHLFLMARTALQNEGGIPPGADERLCLAAEVLASAVACDGRLPSIGDGDDAVPVSFSPTTESEWWAPVAMAAAAWPERIPRPSHWTQTETTIWSSGAEASELRWAPTRERSYYPDGGWVFARNADSSLHMSIGPVGMRGRGGHGHNDLLSFELTVGDEAFLVDPGSYCYTGDMAARDELRATAGHNSLTVDDEEMAEILGPWSISPDGGPVDPEVSFDGATVRVACSTGGYLRLADPVAVRRTLTWTPCRSDVDVEVTDLVTAMGTHQVRRHLHLAPGWDVELLSAREACCRSGAAMATISCDRASELGTTTSFVTQGYGRRRNAPVLVATTTAGGSSALQLRIRATPSSVQ